jgi:pimeloyl-ACP methyl ester carboxylesterase
MRIHHGRIWLELHELVRRDGPALLLLHTLHGSSRDWGDGAPAAWPGSVYALDFSGHGDSDWISGGGYYPELLASDADAALAHIGRAALAGAGLGAYVALLLAGARPESVPAALLLPGAGLDGSGAAPDYDRGFPILSPTAEPARTGCDPLVMILDDTVRPFDYAAAFAENASRLLLLEDHTPRPPWWEAVRASVKAEVVVADLRVAFDRLSSAAT